MLFIPEETRKRFLSSDKTEDLRALEISARLRKVGLRPTKQRLNIGKLLFGATHRHITADDLFQEIQTTGQNLSLATIYNTLHHFSEAGLLRRICTGSERVYFDTDTGDHHHFYVQDEDALSMHLPAIRLLIVCRKHRLVMRLQKWMLSSISSPSDKQFH